jgi:hypothetical protein
VRARQPAIAAYALSRLDLASGGTACALKVDRQLIDRHTDGSYAVLRLTGHCPQSGPALVIDYRLLFDIDPTHRGLMQYVHGGRTDSVIFASDAVSRHSARGRVWTQLVAYIHEGVWHILARLRSHPVPALALLPAVLSRSHGTWDAGIELPLVVLGVAKSLPPSPSRIRSRFRSRRWGCIAAIALDRIRHCPLGRPGGGE